MAVIPKYTLKSLFEAGDLMTEVNFVDFIDSAYNPTLVAGADIQLTTVSTPSGDTITISSTGGGGAPIIEGPGIDITTVGSDKKISIDLDTSQTNIIFNGSDKLSFAGVHIKDEGLAVGTYPTINFVGVDVLAEDSGTPGQVNVYIPTPTFASHYNTTDGTTNGLVSENTPRNNVRISTPTLEGSPFFTGGWAGTNKPAYNGTGAGQNILVTNGLVTGLSPAGSGDAKIQVIVTDGGGNIISDNTSPVLNGILNYLTPDLHCTIQVTGYAQDTSKWKGKITVSVDMPKVFQDAALSGGRYFIKTIMTTDTLTDGGNSYTYIQNDVFWDKNDLGGYPSSPQINGQSTIVENASSILSKHLSGVEYYISGSQFEVDVTDIDYLNSNTQGRSSAAQWNFQVLGDDYGLSPIQEEAWNPSPGMSFPGWNNNYDTLDIDFDYNAWPITANNYRFRNNDATVAARAWDPWLTGLPPQTASSPQPVLIDTYGITSDNLTERFDDENERLTTVGGSYTGFNSVQPLVSSGLTNQTTSALTTGPFCQAAVVGGTLIRPDKFYADNGNSPAPNDLIGNLVSYKPNGGTGSPNLNPNYNQASYQVPATFHRLFEASPSNQGRPISSFELTFSGSFVGGTVYDSLVSNDLRIYVRKKAAASSPNIGIAAIPHSLHNSNPFGGSYQDPPAAIDDNTQSQCRTTTSPSSIISGSFGTSPALDGFYIEVQIHNPLIIIDGISATIIFSSGSPTTESGGIV